MSQATPYIGVEGQQKVTKKRGEIQMLNGLKIGA